MRDMKRAAVGELVRRAREDVGLTQAELAAAVGTSQTAISAIEHGRRQPGEALLQRLFSAVRLRPSVPLELHAQEIRELAAAHGLENVRVFGSVVRGDDGPDSDVDVLASRRPAADAFTVYAFPSRAADLLGFPVDLVLETDRGASMDEISATAVPL